MHPDGVEDAGDRDAVPAPPDPDESPKEAGWSARAAARFKPLGRRAINRTLLILRVRKSTTSPAKVRPEKEPVDLVAHSRQAESVRKAIFGNVVPLTSLATFLFVVVKVLLVSRGSVPTAQAIMEQSGTLTVVTGVILSNIAFIATGLTNTIYIFAGSESRFNRFQRRRLWYSYAIAVGVLSLILPWFNTSILLAAGFVYFIRWAWTRRKRPIVLAASSGEAAKGGGRSLETKEARDEFFASLPDDSVTRIHWKAIKSGYEKLDQAAELSADERNAVYAEIEAARIEYNARIELVAKATRPALDALALSLVLTTMAPLIQYSLNDRPWLPAENLTLADRSVVSGYVLSESFISTVVLTEKDRLVMTIPTPDVKRRQICTPKGDSSHVTTIWSIGQHKAGYPHCVQ